MKINSLLMKGFPIFLIVSAFFLALSSGVSKTQASGEIVVFVDSKKLIFDVSPELKNDRTFVPMRAIFESLGANINWDQGSRTVFAFGNGKAITLQVGNKGASANGKSITLDAEPYLKDDRTLVPLRFVSEAMGATVDWKNNGGLKIYIRSPQNTAPPQTTNQPQFTSDGKPIDRIRINGNIFK